MNGTSLVECPACGSPESCSLRILRNHFGRGEYDLHACARCDMRYLKNPPPVGQMEQHYQNFAGQVMRSRSSRLFRKLQRIRLAKDFGLLRGGLAPETRILDYGAGDGSFCEFLQSEGFQVKGVDFYPEEHWPVRSVPYASMDLNGCSVKTEGLKFPDGKPPEVVVIRHVLEHLSEPRKILSAFRAAGVRKILIIVPNVRSRLLETFGSYWYYWDPPRHISFFSFSSLETLAKESGFVISRRAAYGIDEVISSLYRMALLKRNAPQGAPPPAWLRLLQPKGPFAMMSSCISNYFLNTVCMVVLENESL